MSVPCVPLSPLVCAPLSSVCCSGCVCGRILSLTPPLQQLGRAECSDWPSKSSRSVRHACTSSRCFPLSFSLTRFLTGCTQCMTAIICITSYIELISLSSFDHIHIINTSISFSLLHTVGCSLCCFVSLSVWTWVLLLSTQGCIDIVKQYIFMGIFDTLNRLWIKCAS